MADRTDDPRIGQVIAGYRIEERVGRGGMGVVYRAEHLNLRRRAAIKIIAPDLAESEGFRERFTREARIAAVLQHPNIVTVYDAGEVDGVLYLAMQYIEGQDLAAVLRKDGRLRPYRAIDVIRQVASALDAAHAQGLVHRDVKPANVLIEGEGEDMHCILTDFGLMKNVSNAAEPLTRAGSFLGSCDYAAPEQLLGETIDARVDVYALGCMLYQAVTGVVPFPRPVSAATMLAHMDEPPPIVSEQAPDAPRALDDVIRTAMAKDPQERYPTAGALGRAALTATRS